MQICKATIGRCISIIGIIKMTQAIKRIAEQRQDIDLILRGLPQQLHRTVKIAVSHLATR